MLFKEWSNIWEVLLLAVLIYAWVVLVLRIYGKRTLAKLNAFDFIVTVALGSMMANVILSSSTTWMQGATAFIALGTLQWLVATLSLRWPWFFHLVRSSPRLLLYEGELLHDAMRKERVGVDDLRAAVRKHGARDFSDVHAVVLETDGTLSVLAQPGDGSTMCDVTGYEEKRRKDPDLNQAPVLRP